jgi:hypothetical protein
LVYQWLDSIEHLQETKEFAIRYPEMAAHILGGPLFIFPYHPIAGLSGTKGDRMGIVHEDMIMGYETNHLGMLLVVIGWKWGIHQPYRDRMGYSDIYNHSFESWVCLYNDEFFFVMCLSNQKNITRIYVQSHWIP